MVSAVKYYTHGQPQSMASDIMITSWWQPHTLVQVRKTPFSVDWPCHLMADCVHLETKLYLLYSS